MTIEILPLDLQALAYPTAVMDDDGNVIEQASFPHNRYVAARRWAKQMRRKYGGTIIDHTAADGSHCVAPRGDGNSSHTHNVG